MRLRLTRLSASFAGALVLTLLSIVPAASVQAASCRGSSCTGRDPMQTLCYTDATTLAKFYNRYEGWYELRYSRRCDASWARFRPAANADPTISNGHPGIWVEARALGDRRLIRRYSRNLNPDRFVWTRMTKFSRNWVRVCEGTSGYDGYKSCTPFH